MGKKLKKIITKYCWIGFSLIASSVVIYLFKVPFIGSIFLGSGLTIIILNLLGILKR
jgi:hypothetical protein